MAQISTFAVALGGSEQDIQNTDHLVRKCYWAVRCLSVLLRDKLHQEGLWPDLMQEIEIAAWEAGRKGLSDRDDLMVVGQDNGVMRLQPREVDGSITGWKPDPIAPIGFTHYHRQLVSAMSSTTYCPGSSLLT